MILKRAIIFLLAVLVVFLLPVRPGEIHKAAKDGDITKIKSLLEKDPKLINAGNRLEQAPLEMAAWGGHKEIVAFLIEKGANVNQVDIFGAAPLHMAVVQGHKEIVELLLEKGADINVKTKNGKIPLQLAFENERPAIIELFINRGLDIDSTINEYNRTLLHKAVIMGKKKIVDFLVTKGADITARDKNGKNALDLATICGHKEMAELLVAKGAQTAVKPTLEVTYIANAGFLISVNELKQKILIDALFQSGFGKYPVPPKGVLEDMGKAKAPFDNVDLFLVTHKNAPHFDPLMTENYLAGNPGVVFLASREVGLELELYGSNFAKIKRRVTAVTPAMKSGAAATVNGITMKILRLRHLQAVQNLGYVATLGGKTFCHMGDASVKNNKDIFETHKLNKEGIDVAFILYWDFLDADARKIIKENIRPGHIILMHIPQAEIEQVSREIEKHKKDFPGVTIFKKSMEKKVFK